MNCQKKEEAAPFRLGCRASLAAAESWIALFVFFVFFVVQSFSFSRMTRPQFSERTAA
jgi:hypothetical protein